MPSPLPLADRLARGGALPARAFGPLVCLVLALLGWAALRAAPAHAEDETVEQLRERLLKARTQGEREGALKVILTRPAEKVGATLGPLFSRPELGASSDLLVATAKLLAESPVPGPGGKPTVILLADAIFRRATSESGFVTRLRDTLAVDPVTEQAPGWDRLVDNALSALDATPPRSAAERRAAIRFLSFEDGLRAGRVVDELERHARRLRQQVSESPQERILEVAALLDAFGKLLVYSFGSLDVALPELEATRGWTYVRRLRHFSGLKTAADRDRSLAVLHGMTAIRAMAAASELTAVFTSEQFPYPEHQTAALARAAQLKPAPGPQWEEFYRAVLAHTTESGVVQSALDQLAEAGFGGGPRECCRAISEAVYRRLSTPAFQDAADVRRRLVATLGDMAATEQVRQLIARVLERRTVATEEVDEVVELVRAAGRCEGLEVGPWLKPFYDLTQITLPEVPSARERVRTAVARSLGREGVRTTDPEAAVVALEGILEGAPDWERAVSPRVREEAFRSLATYPTDAVVRALVRTALRTEAGSEVEALLAVESLGQMLVSGPEGARRGAAALASVLEQTRDRRDAEARRVEALKRLRGLPKDEAVSAELRDAVLAAVRGSLEDTATDPVRAEAARTAAELADVDALPRLVAWWEARPEPPVGDALRALLEAAVRAGPAGDGRVAEALVAVATLPAHASQAVVWADLVVRAAPRPVRPALLRAQARTLMLRAASRPRDGTGREGIVEDLSAASVVLKTVVSAAGTPEEAEPARRQLVEALELLATALGDGPTAADRLVEAVSQAGRSRDRVLLQSGERLARRLLTVESLRQHLSAERQADLKKQLDTIVEALQKQE
jgi:hypothetical protein